MQPTIIATTGSKTIKLRSVEIGFIRSRVIPNASMTTSASTNLSKAGRTQSIFGGLRTNLNIARKMNVMVMSAATRMSVELSRGSMALKNIRKVSSGPSTTIQEGCERKPLAKCTNGQMRQSRPPRMIVAIFRIFFSALNKSTRRIEPANNNPK